MPSGRHLPEDWSNDSPYASHGSMQSTEQAAQRPSRRSAEPHNINSRDPPVNFRPLKPVSHGEQQCTGKRMTTRRLSTVDSLPKSQAVTTFAHSLAYPLRHRQDLLDAAERNGRRTLHSQAPEGVSGACTVAISLLRCSPTNRVGSRNGGQRGVNTRA